MNASQLWTQTRATRAVTIARPFAVVMEYLSDPMNYSAWAVEYFTSSVVKIDENSYRVPTTMGEKKFRLVCDRERGEAELFIADIDQAFSYGLPIRVLHNGDGVDVTFTLAREDILTDKLWDDSIRMLERELIALRDILEKSD